MFARLYLLRKGLANGLRYPRVGGTRQRRLAGTSFKPRKLSENAQTPTSRVHYYPDALTGRCVGQC
jgi:hypothetical protein